MVDGAIDRGSIDNRSLVFRAGLSISCNLVFHPVRVVVWESSLRPPELDYSHITDFYCLALNSPIDTRKSPEIVYIHQVDMAHPSFFERQAGHSYPKAVRGLYLMSTGKPSVRRVLSHSQWRASHRRLPDSSSTHGECAPREPFPQETALQQFIHTTRLAHSVGTFGHLLMRHARLSLSFMDFQSFHNDGGAENQEYDRKIGLLCPDPCSIIILRPPPLLHNQCSHWNKFLPYS